MFDLIRQFSPIKARPVSIELIIKPSQAFETLNPQDAIHHHCRSAYYWNESPWTPWSVQHFGNISHGCWNWSNWKWDSIPSTHRIRCTGGIIDDLESGYQGMLTYMRSDGSFSAFGTIVEDKVRITVNMTFGSDLETKHIVIGLNNQVQDSFNGPQKAIQESVSEFVKGIEVFTDALRMPYRYSHQLMN